jgi:hypothetical protein
MTDPRPLVFVGSSKEGLLIAEAIQANLDHDCQVQVWNQGFFGLSGNTPQTLAAQASEFDFAILVLTPDDLIWSRGEAQESPRDNLLFELGFFSGVLGQERTFIVYDRTAELKLPSDLAGVTLATFQPQDRGNIHSTVGTPCTKIKAAIGRLGVRRRVETAPTGVGLRSRRDSLLPSVSSEFGDAQHIDLLGYTLLGLFAKDHKYLESKANAGCKFRILLLNPSSDEAVFVGARLTDSRELELAAKDFEERIGRVRGDIERTVIDLRPMLKTGNVELKYISLATPYSLTIFDPKLPKGKVRVELYSFNMAGPDRPYFELTKAIDKKWYDFFIDQFERLWQTATPYSEDHQ